MQQINYGAVIVDIVIIMMAVFVSVWQDDTNYLWLLVFSFATGS